ncbi:MAG: uroporphyrinogen-III C-methyltransferase, partial [Stellaceae bacterium]
DEPAAIIAQATTPAQRVVETTLARAAADAAAAGIVAPAMLVVGPAVRLRHDIRWFEQEIPVDSSAPTSDAEG